MIKTIFAAVGAAALVIASPLVHADPGGGQADLSQPFSSAGGPFIGEWQAHGEHVTVNGDGTGTEVYRTGSLTFHLLDVQQPQTAYGNVDSGGNAGRGAFVTMQLVDGGNGMLFSTGGGDNGFPFCKVVGGSAVNRNDCGA
jgi:hypothetical protein